MPAKKLSKKQLDQLKKAEAAKKAEQDRKREEEQKRKDEEAKKQMIQLQLKMAEEERLRLAEEKEMLAPWLQKLAKIKQEIQIQNLQKQNWEKYTSCDSKPNPLFTTQLSAFYLQYSQSVNVPKQDKMQLIDNIIRQCQYSEDIVKDIIRIIYRFKSNCKDTKECEDYVQNIRKITVKKLENIMGGLTLIADTIIQADIRQREKDAPPTKQPKHDDKKSQTTRKYQPQTDFKFGVFINQSSTKTGYKFQKGDFQQFGVSSQFPGKLMNASLILRCQWFGFDPYSNPQIYQKQIVVGGVLVLQFYELLQSNKKINNWALKTDYDGAQVLQKTKIGLAPNAKQSSFNVNYELPSYIYLKTVDKYNMKVAAFDFNTGKWSTSFINETPTFDSIKAQKCLQFQLSKQGPVAYIQDRCTDYPYRSWQIRSVGPEQIYLDIVGKRQKFQFSIRPGYVCLRNRKQKQLIKFVDSKMQPGIFLYQMSRSGIHLLPVQQDADVAKIKHKNKQSQQLAIRDLSICVKSFFIRSSKFSNQVQQSQVIIRIRENLDYDSTYLQDQEKDWISICFQPYKCSALGLKDSENYPNKDKVKDTLAHGSLDLLLQSHQLCPKQCLQRMRNLKEVELLQTLQGFLRLSRLLSFTVLEHQFQIQAIQN